MLYWHQKGGEIMAQMSNGDKIRIGEAVRIYRERNGISLKQFGEALGISPQAVSKWEHGTTYPDITMIPAIAELLGVSVASLFGEEPASAPPNEQWSIYIIKHR